LERSFERFYKSNGVEIIVVNNEALSPQEEMIQDLINIIHVFSCRIYGLKNINKTSKVKKLEKKLKREQRKLSRKYESLKNKTKNKKEATRQNISKQIVKVQILYQKLTNIRHNYINQVVNEVVKANPQHITIEDLNVKGMMKNRHLAKAVAKQSFYHFRIKLEHKCKISNIELRVVSRFYPSSKTCSCCGYIKKDLTLSDRVYICNDCGF
jgi:putative transposase